MLHRQRRARSNADGKGHYAYEHLLETLVNIIKMTYLKDNTVFRKKMLWNSFNHIPLRYEVLMNENAGITVKRKWIARFLTYLLHGISYFFSSWLLETTGHELHMESLLFNLTLLIGYTLIYPIIHSDNACHELHFDLSDYPLFIS